MVYFNFVANDIEITVSVTMSDKFLFILGRYYNNVAAAVLKLTNERKQIHCNPCKVTKLKSFAIRTLYNFPLHYRYVHTVYS